MLGRMRARLPRETQWPDPPRKGWDPGPSHDGDTPTFELDQLLSDQRGPVPVRLVNTWCPEVVPLQTGAKETRQYACDWLVTVSNAAPGWWPFWVQTYWVKTEEHEVFTFSRLVAMVTNWDDTRCLNFEVMAFVDANGYPHGTGSDAARAYAQARGLKLRRGR